ncbi:17605_t:CDS:2, partial [Gigaspora rosea]
MDNEDKYSTENNSETETAPSISTTISVSTTLSASSANSLVQKKRRTIYAILPNKTKTKSRSNCSHTTFFSSDSKNSSIAYCKDTVKLLSPFKKITRCICGAKYCTLSFVYPYVELLKKSFAPKFENNESYDTYLNLIYGSQCENISEEESDSSISDGDEIPTSSSRQHWQYAHHQFRQKMHDFNRIEYLPVASTTGLLQKVWAAIYLSLEELWPTPSNLVRIATLIDPILKIL